MFRVSNQDYPTLQAATNAANEIYHKTGIIVAVEESARETIIVLGYGGGYYDCRIERNPDNSATVEWRTQEPDTENMRIELTTYHDTPRDALLAVANRLGW